MSVAFDAALQPQVNGSVTSVTRSFTTSGTDRFLNTWGLTTSVADMTGVTYNSVSLTKAGELNVDAFATETYYLINPASGANNIVWSNGTSTTFVTSATSYNGVKQSFTPTTNTSTGNSSTMSGTLTTVSDNSWIVWNTRNNSGAAATGTNYVRRADNAINGVSIGDTDAAITPAGATSVSVTAGSSAPWGVFMMEIEEATGGTANTTNFFHMM